MYQILAWVLIAVAWVATPFINDRVPTLLGIGYWALIAVAGVYGTVLGIRRRNWLLLIVSVLTFFAWPITLVLILSFAGIN